MSVCKGCGTELAPRDPHVPAPPRKWCSERCRKQTLYSRPCADCGKPLNGSNGTGPNAYVRCQPCGAKHSGAERKVWTREAIVAAIREWVDTYGEPPAANDWNVHGTRHWLHDEARARRFEEADGHWPSHNSVFREFHSWNAALVAAGFDPRSPHGGDGNQFRQRRLAA